MRGVGLAGWRTGTKGGGWSLKKKYYPGIFKHIAHTYITLHSLNYMFLKDIYTYDYPLSLYQVLKLYLRKDVKMQQEKPMNSDQKSVWPVALLMSPVCVCVNDRTLGKSVFIKIGRPGVLWHQAATIRERLTSTRKFSPYLAAIRVVCAGNRQSSIQHAPGGTEGGGWCIWWTYR